jgi:ABC-type phosphate transport system auxiliary subunit
MSLTNLTDVPSIPLIKAGKETLESIQQDLRKALAEVETQRARLERFTQDQLRTMTEDLKRSIGG